MASTVPTLYEWIGGIEPLRKLLTIFYTRVLADDLLHPIFEHMDPKHAEKVADFIGEVLGGPATYATEHGGDAHMISQHLGRNLTERHRRRWVELLIDSADEAGLPNDPEFRSAFLAYIEWGSRLAVNNSQPGVTPGPDEPMPKWGWGETKGPYQPE